MESKQVARTILNQLHQSVPAPVIWSWGASAYRFVKAEQILPNHLGGLLFYVRGHKFKGQVLITLSFDDTYLITIGHLRKGKISVKYRFDGVHFDQLGGLIDEAIERQPEYQY